MTSRPATRRTPRSWTLRGLGAVAIASERLSALSSRRRPVSVVVDRRIAARVTEVAAVADDVVSLRLEAVSGAPLPPWQPGAHLDVELGASVLRQYSLTGDPAAHDHYRIAVRRIDESAGGGGGSQAMHRLRVGDELTLRGPRNAFPYIRTGRYLFVAGGIGITPILPMLRDAVGRGADWRFVYTGRTRASMPFLDEIEALAAAWPGRIHVRADDEWGVPSGAEIVALAPAGAALYTCGPPPMIAAIREQIPARNVRNVRSLHYERFSAPPVVGGSPFEVELARSGQVVPVAADESALAAIRRVLPDVPYSCRQGFCGTCPVGVIGYASLEHHDRCLTPAEQASQLAICVSRATGRVVLDL